MAIKQLTLLAAILISLPNVVLAGDVDVQAGKVRITTSDRGVSVNTANGVINSRSNRYRKRYCVKRRSSNRYRCYYKTKSQIDSRRPSVYRDSTWVNPTYEGSTRRVRSSSSHTCRGNSTYSNQEITQSSSSGKVYVENSISTSGCN